MKARFAAAALVYVLALSTAIAQPADPLPSWKDGKAKQSILDFVAKVTTEGSPEFVPAAERIATFDNDGTLWLEQPIRAFLRDCGVDAQVGEAHQAARIHWKIPWRPEPMEHREIDSVATVATQASRRSAVRPCHWQEIPSRHKIPALATRQAPGKLLHGAN